MLSKILISHPGLQHSHQLASAVHQRGLLQSFWSGVPVLTEDERPAFWLPASYHERIKRVSIPPSFHRHSLLFPALLRAGRWLPSGFSQSDYGRRLDQYFDWWVAQHIAKFRPKVVVAYENSAYYTFKAAKAIGARCILDAASVHHLVGGQLNLVTYTPHLAETNRRLDCEIEQADLILTCSPLAAQSYIRAGVLESKVKSMLLGASPTMHEANWKPHDQPLRFMFAGGLRSLKAIDVILEAFNCLNQTGTSYQLSFVGGEGETGWIKRIKNVPHACYLPAVSQNELYRLMGQTDCLLLPSRFDSFGMVVAEAMACGTPSIVSTQTGSKAIIERFPKAGWIVEPGVESLFRCVKARIDDRASLFSARPYALEAANHFTWAAYRERVGSFIESWMS